MIFVELEGKTIGMVYESTNGWEYQHSLTDSRSGDGFKNEAEATKALKKYHKFYLTLVTPKSDIVAQAALDQNIPLIQKIRS